MQPQLTLSPYLRISQAGFTLDAKGTNTGKCKLHLMRGVEIVATVLNFRSGGVSTQDCLRRCMLNQWGLKSEWHISLQKFADIAEALALQNTKDVWKASK